MSKIEIYRSGHADQWYWHLVAPNGKIIADGAEGYATRYNAKRAALRAMRLMVKACVLLVNTK